MAFSIPQRTWSVFGASMLATFGSLIGVKFTDLGYDCITGIFYRCISVTGPSSSVWIPLTGFATAADASAGFALPGGNVWTAVPLPDPGPDTTGALYDPTIPGGPGYTLPPGWDYSVNLEGAIFAAGAPGATVLQVGIMKNGSIWKQGGQGTAALAAVDKSCVTHGLDPVGVAGDSYQLAARQTGGAPLALAADITAVFLDIKITSNGPPPP